MIDATKVRGADGKGELLVSTRRRVLRSLGIGSRQAVLWIQRFKDHGFKDHVNGDALQHV
jgi:hypothetical protein